MSSKEKCRQPTTIRATFFISKVLLLNASIHPIDHPKPRPERDLFNGYVNGICDFVILKMFNQLPISDLYINSDKFTLMTQTHVFFGTFW